jgi:hypothetical protein
LKPFAALIFFFVTLLMLKLRCAKPGNKKARLKSGFKKAGGEGGIRTPGPVTVNGFQDRRNRPLCHLSGRKIKASNSIFKKKIKLFLKAFTIAGFSNKPFTQLSRIFRI